MSKKPTKSKKKPKERKDINQIAHSVVEQAIGGKLSDPKSKPKQEHES